LRPHGADGEVLVLRVAVMGALGRMGQEVCGAVRSDDMLELAGAVDPAARVPGEVPAPKSAGPTVVAEATLLDPSSIDVIVDFTDASAAIANINWALENGIHCVVGTTGIPDKELERIRVLAGDHGANVIVASNFALGAVLMMRFAELAAGVFDQCEIIELHHRGKRDAPSGTSISTAERIERAMKASPVPPSDAREVEGTRGGALGPVRIHSVRLDGLVAHQEVIFGSTGETLSIRHDTTDRNCFMPGVLLAIKAVPGTPGLTIGIESLLGLA